MAATTSDAPDLVDSRAHGTTIELNGVRTHYAELGDGPPLLLVHGSGPGIDAAMTWDPVLRPLIERFRTIVVDAPGYGRSDMLAVPDTPANVAAHLTALLDELGVDEFSAVGHSRGGRICAEMAVAVRERMSKLVIVCSGSVAPGGHLDDDGQFTGSALALVRYGADGDTSRETFRAAYRTMVVEPHHMSDELLDGVYDTFVEERLEEYVERMQRFDPLAYYHQQDAVAFRERLRTLPMPVSVIWGREDETSSYRRAVELLELIPDVELHVIPRCGHFAQWDRPAALSSLVLEFLLRDADRR